MLLAVSPSGRDACANQTQSRSRSRQVNPHRFCARLAALLSYAGSCRGSLVQGAVRTVCTLPDTNVQIFSHHGRILPQSACPASARRASDAMKSAASQLTEKPQ